MDFKPGYLTNAGQKMARQAINGDIKITFTKAIGSSDDHSNDDADTINALTSLSSFTEEQLNVIGAVDATRELLKISLSNYQMTNQNYLRSVGIYASDGSNEYLYSVLINGDPDLVPAYNGTVPETFDVNWTAYVGRSENVNVTVSPIGMVTEEEFQDLNSKAFKIRQYWTDNIMNLTYQPVGIYGISNNFKNAPEGFSGYGVANVFKNDTDSWIDLIDNTNGRWTVHIGSEWQKVINQIDMDNMDSKAQSYAASAASNVSSTLSSGIANNFQFRGYWNDNLMNLTYQPAGTYGISNNFKEAPEGFSGYGVANVFRNNTDAWIDLIDNTNGRWTVHIGSEWQKNMNNIDMSSMDSRAQSYAASADNNAISYAQSAASNANSYATSVAQYNYIGELGNNDDILNLPERGHYVIRGTNPANNPWVNTNIWADVYKSEYQTIIRDNLGNEYIRSVYDNSWKQTLTNVDRDIINSNAQSYATSAASSASTNLSAEIDNGYQFRGYYTGSFNDLRNKKRGTYALAQYSDGMPNGFSGYGNLVVSGNDTDTYFTLNDNLGGMWTKVNSDMWHAVSVNDDTNSVFKNRGYWNDNIMNLTYQPAGTYGISNNFKNAPDGFSGYGVANVYKNDTDSWVDLIDNTNGRWTVHIGSEWQKVINQIDLADAMGNKVTDNHDGTITFNGYTQAMFKTVTAAVDYNDLASPGRFILPNNVSGTYVNSPLQLVGVEGTVIVDVINNNNGDIYQTAYVPSVNTTLYRQFSFQKWTDWIQLATNQQVTNLQTQINTIDASIFYRGTIDGSTDLNNLTTPGIYMCSYTVPLNSPSQFSGNFPRFKIQVSSVATGIVNQAIYMFDGLGANSMPSYFNRNSTSPGVWNAWQHTDTI